MTSQQMEHLLSPRAPAYFKEIVSTWMSDPHTVQRWVCKQWSKQEPLGHYMLVWYHVKFRIHKHDWLDVFARNAAFASKHKPECHHLHQISHGSLGRQCQHWWKDAPQSQIGSEILGLDCRSEAWKVNFFLKWNNTAKEQKLTGNRLTCRVWNQNQKVCWNIAVGQKHDRQVIILLWKYEFIN